MWMILTWGLRIFVVQWLLSVNKIIKILSLFYNSTTYFTVQIIVNTPLSLEFDYYTILTELFYRMWIIISDLYPPFYSKSKSFIILSRSQFLFSQFFLHQAFAHDVKLHEWLSLKENIVFSLLASFITIITGGT